MHIISVTSLVAQILYVIFWKQKGSSVLLCLAYRSFRVTEEGPFAYHFPGVATVMFLDISSSAKYVYEGNQRKAVLK